MSTLLLELHGNMELNHTIWPPHLYVYDDLLIYKKRKFFRVNEITLSYSHIVRVNLLKGLIFASIELVTSADENIEVKFIGKKQAMQAKKILDRKIYTALAKHNTEHLQSINPENDFERSMQRLKELSNKGRLTKADFDKKKADLLKKLR